MRVVYLGKLIMAQNMNRIRFIIQACHVNYKIVPQVEASRKMRILSLSIFGFVDLYN